MRPIRLIPLASSLWVLLSLAVAITSLTPTAQSAPIAPGDDNAPAAVVLPASPSYAEGVAGREIRRYAFQRTGVLLPIITTERELPDGDLILVGHIARFLDEQSPAGFAGVAGDRAAFAEAHSELQPDGYLLRTAERDGRSLQVVAGCDATSILRGAYRLAEHWGVRYYMHGDVIPDARHGWQFPQVDESRRPLFSLRGIQPFHDFPEGPDWWSRDDHKAVLAQLPKLGMNFIGFHTYPEGGVGPEPLVWIGQPNDIGRGNQVQSSYPARHFLSSNVTGAWGYRGMDTGDYCMGAAALFEVDDFGADYMQGYSPWTEMSQEQSNRLFAAMGDVLDDAFTFARRLGVKTCVGTETPLVIPTAVRERLIEQGKDPDDPEVVREVYAGMFQRIAQTHPLDYYWFWTPEGWTWRATTQAQIDATVTDLEAAIAASEQVGAPFTLATCGWVLGPHQDRAMFDEILPKEMPMSCINRSVGHEPVEPGFARVEGRPKWAIPWLEDDPAMCSPQLWVGRMRKDAADALAYGCTGLMGIHWRTRQLGPNVSALAQAAWRQESWNPQFGGAQPSEPPPPPQGPVGGNHARFPGAEIADTDEAPVYRSVRYNVSAYHFDLPNGAYRVTLKFCEPHYGEAGKRVFGVKIEDRQVLENFDIFESVGKNRAKDFVYEDIQVDDGRLTIEFTYEVEYPSIAGIVLEGPETIRVNCGGEAWEDYRADWPAAPATPADRFLPCDDFYRDWSQAMFGADASPEIAELFGEIDSELPRPITWVRGPGGIQPDPRAWEEVAPEYAFVDRLSALRKTVAGPGNLERFDYWLDQFRYLRAVAKVRCIWAECNAVFAQAEAEEIAAAKAQTAREVVLPVWIRLVRETAAMHELLLAHVSTYGGLGNVANWQQHNFPGLLYEPGKKLEAWLGEPLPKEAQIPQHYSGRPRLIVPTVRSLLEPGEPLRLKVIVLGAEPEQVVLRHRAIGSGQFESTPLEHTARGVYRAEIPAEAIPGDLEYYITAEADTPAGGTTLRFPATAPELNQTLIVAPTD